jgi:glycine cleavage system H protein
MYYAKSHEYINYSEATKIGVVGITDTAQSLLGDIVNLELPEVGARVDAGSELGTIESVKTADAVICPVSGSILEINERISDSPEILN